MRHASQQFFGNPGTLSAVNFMFCCSPTGAMRAIRTSHKPRPSGEMSRIDHIDGSGLLERGGGNYGEVPLSGMPTWFWAWHWKVRGLAPTLGANDANNRP